eukprot:scaffold20170_cov78-Isochrysis_galbana.AAC.3
MRELRRGGRHPPRGRCGRVAAELLGREQAVVDPRGLGQHFELLVTEYSAQRGGRICGRGGGGGGAAQGRAWRVAAGEGAKRRGAGGCPGRAVGCDQPLHPTGGDVPRESVGVEGGDSHSAEPLNRPCRQVGQHARVVKRPGEQDEVGGQLDVVGGPAALDGCPQPRCSRERSGGGRDPLRGPRVKGKVPSDAGAKRGRTGKVEGLPVAQRPVELRLERSVYGWGTAADGMGERGVEGRARPRVPRAHKVFHPHAPRPAQPPPAATAQAPAPPAAARSQAGPASPASRRRPARPAPAGRPRRPRRLPGWPCHGTAPKT